MRIRRRNWIIKRIALGFAVAALVAPAAAQARVDEGINGQPNKAGEAGVVTKPTARPSGMPSAGLNDYLRSRDGVEVVRTQPRSTLRSSDLIENTRVSPRNPVEVVSASGFDWSDAGIGAGLAIGLVLVGGVAFRATKHLGQPQTA
ncbi:MAG TPA: hypothetical protein VE693_04400 [Gaiellaceae bacterium]|jgi:hypothetical protein|nr:hypothetical protein [Gaiellaceae bacterium]